MRLWPVRKREGSDLDMADVSIQPQVDRWMSALYDTTTAGLPWSPRMQDALWVVNRCLQLNSQQVASMPLRFFGSYEPAWIANPDPAWYPNGIGDAVFAIVWSQYAWGDAFLYVTDRYANGYPATWTVLDPAAMSVDIVNGERVYSSNGYPLDHEDVIQISRDPRGGARGTSALKSYASLVWGSVGLAELSRQMATGGGIPNSVLKSTRKLTDKQAEALQTQWINARARSAVGAPAVLPPEISFETLQLSASDLALLDTAQFGARAIASAFGVPAYMLNMPLEGGLTYQNPQMMFEVWWRSELRPVAGRVQRALSANMLPRGSWVEFDARAILAPTFDQQVTSWLALQAAGVVTKDEVRAAILHLPPATQGEALDELTEPPTAAASPGELPSTSEEATVTELRPTLTSTGV